MERVNLGSVDEENEKDDNTESYFIASKVEEYHEGRDEDEDSKPDINTRRVDSSTFEGICDGVVSAIALVHEAMQDLLEFKDEMLKHALPPTVLTRLALITGRVFRSISDLGVPVGELVRMVRVYSAPWKEQSIALRKLHESYESKHRQLNIAIKRLQMLDEQSKQMARERRIMNWEKLFLNVTNAKSHGRQWKFFIQTIKQKAKLGLEHVQAYTQSLEESSKSVEEETYPEDEDDVNNIHDSVEAHESGEDDQLKGPESVTSEETKDSKDDQTEEVHEAVVQTGKMAIVQTGRVAYTGIESALKKVQIHESIERSVTIKPPIQDAQTWTQEPEFDRSLFVRIFCPEGFQQPKLKCSLSYNGKIFKTPILDNPNDETSSDKMSDVMKVRPSERPHAAGNVLDRSRSDAIDSKSGSPSGKRKRFCELQIQLPDEVKAGISVFGKKHLSEPEVLRFAVHKGKFEEIIAMTSIDFKDIKQMNLEKVYLPPPHGDDDVPTTHSRTNSLSLDGDSLCDSVDIPIMEDDPSDHLKTSSHEDLIKNHTPQLFPLYSLQSGISDHAQVSCGNVPMLMYWGMRVRPLHFNRQCGTRAVLNMTDFDLASTASEELHKETADEALSVITFTPGTEEETVPRTEYDTMMEQHHQEMTRIQEEYEKRMEELIGNMQAMHPDVPVTSHQSRPVSKTSAYSGAARVSPATRQSESNLDRARTDSVLTHGLPGSATSRQRPVPPRTQRPAKNFRVGHRLPRWGEHLSQDFFERLSQWEEESKHHKQELNEKTLKDIKDNLERKLAGQYKLNKCEEQMYDALRDVSIPALFMPFKTGSVYNPRAHQYFQPTGATSVRLTQPPSIFQLPPLPKSKLSVVNLFELSKNFHIQGPTWLVEQYINDLEPMQMQEDFQPTPPLDPASLHVSTSEKALFNENLDSISISRDKEVES